MIDYRNPLWLRDALAANPIKIVALSAASGVSRNQITRIAAGSPCRTDTFVKLESALTRLSRAAA